MPSCCGSWASQADVTLDAIVARYGLAALFLGAGLEGEAAVVTGGLLAHRGLFPLWAAMLVAASGSFTADQLWFLIGRRFRSSARVRRAQLRPAFAKALAMFERHPVGFIFAFRFIYGFRTISPIAIGTTQVSPRLFVAVNLVSAIVWGAAFTAIGYLFGHGFARLLGRSLPSTPVLVAIVAGVLALLGLVYVLRRKRAA
jgi:membrane protein DedA with SNARE-associated domain